MPPKRSTSTKRSAPDSAKSTQTKPAKISKKEETSSTKNGASEKPAKTSSASASNEQIIKWLLSDEAWQLAYPPIPAGKGEVDLPTGAQAKAPPKRPSASASSSATDKKKAKKEGGGGSETGTLSYPSLELTPFQSLVCSSLLSKPISHRLGLRAISTLFNPPYSYRDASSLLDAGFEGRRAALWDARTQHKEKTAEGLGQIVEGLKQICEDDDAEDLKTLHTLKTEAERAAKASNTPSDSISRRLAAKDALLAQLLEIKGIGKGACEIFFRRIQHQWDVLFPFADARSLEYAHQLGLVSSAPPSTQGKDVDEDKVNKELLQGADELAEVMEQATGKEEKKDTKARAKDFVKLLDVLIGLGLEKKLDEVRTKASTL